ncbi:MAG: pyrimidine dimer DNA glycosylase/endonuclease V [archaeon]|jgi:hypothetical protein
MRLWSLSPQYLDRQGLLAVWREGLLAKKVLQGKTKGYKNHPQLIRFKAFKNPKKAINSYLYFVFLESQKRGYVFDKTKINCVELKGIIEVNSGQIEFELEHLLKKLKNRDLEKFKEIKKLKGKIKTNLIFKTKKGKIESWEKIN